MRASDLLARCLVNEGVEHVFGVPGEENLDVMDSFLDSNLLFIPTRHEQGAAFMADVYGRLSGKAGVCLSTLGPGATNLLTGVADAHLDRAPLVAITGQVSLDRMHKEFHQYVDVLSLFKPLTKWNAEITQPQIIPETVRKAFKVAQTEKPGATHLELPEDVAAARLGPTDPSEPLKVQAPFTPEPLPSQIKRAVEVLCRAQRPVILAGNGAIRGHAHEAVRKFARALNVPVVQTFMGKGIVPDSDPMSLYTIGLQMRDYVSLVMERADVVLTVGYDFVEYAPSLWNPNRDQRIVHVDVSPAEVDAHYVVEVGVLGDLSLSLGQLAVGLSPFDPAWIRNARQSIVSGFDQELDEARSFPLRPQHVIQDVRANLDPGGIVICDVGAHKLWMARMFPCQAPRTCVISNGFASMGIALPGAIAAKMLFPEHKVLAVTGDGGFLMNSQELETAIRLQLPVVVLIWRDNGYGVIRWKQSIRFSRTSSVDFGNPDFLAYAESYGAAGFRVAGPDELGPVLERAFSCGRPAVIDCQVDYGENLRLTDRLKRL